MTVLAPDSENPHVKRSRDAVVRARRVRLLVLDVDGVLTDGRMVISERGDELKFFHTHDGMGVNVAQRSGIKVVLVTGEKSTIAQTRGAKLGVDEVVLGARRKGEVIDGIPYFSTSPRSSASGSPWPPRTPWPRCGRSPTW